MKMAYRVLVFYALIHNNPFALAQGTTSDWRTFRGNNGTATSTEKGFPSKWSSTENILWKTDLPGAGSSTPIVIGQKVFVTCYSGYNVPNQARGKQEDLKLHVVCLDRSSGKILWKQDVTPKLPEQENIRDGHGYASSSPVADDTHVFAFFGKSGVFAFDHAGKKLWQADVGDKLSGWGSGASLLLFDDYLIVNASVESERLYALDKKTGKEVWHINGIREAWNTPVLARVGDSTELVVPILGKILGIDPKTGKELWSCTSEIQSYMVPSPVVTEGIVYIIGGRTNGGLAIKLGGRGDVTKTHRLWTIKKGGNVSSPIYHDGYLYWMHDNTGVAYCVDVKTGNIVYEERIPRADQVYGSPVLAEGKIYYPARNGTTYVVAAKPKFELLETNSWGERGTYNASPALAGKHIFLRSDRFVCCVGNK